MTTAVREKPILFSGAMVRAILDGRKTQTRRLVKPQPQVTSDDDAQWRDGKADLWRNSRQYARDCCPYGEPGGQLWVRETWLELRPEHWHDERRDRKSLVGDCGIPRINGIAYAADTRPGSDGDRCRLELGYPTWKPSIHMPRWASRLTLEVTGVRAERLQEISGRDCAAEGCEPDWEAFNDATCCEDGWEEPEEFVEECEDECDWINFGHDLVHSREHQEWERDRQNYALRLAYQYLWDRINGKSHPWSSNPWVWVIEFRKL